MKKVIQVSQYLLLVSFLFLYSCKKNIQDVQVDDPLKTEIANKVTAWLDGQQARMMVSVNKTRIENLKENLDLSNLRLEALNDGEKFVVVPIRNSFRSKNNAGKNLTAYCLFILNKAGGLRKGNIVQYLPDDNSAKPLPVNTFYKMYNFKRMEVNGKFVFLSVADHLQYSYEYKQGELTAYSEVQKGKGSGTTSTTQRTASCIDWYEVTTYYYPDGTTYTEEQYLYTTCGGCDPNQPQACPEELDPNGDGGGGGGGSDAEEQMAFTTKEWIYEVNSAGNWAVVPTEGFNGVKRSSLPNGGYFTEFRHAEDGFMSTSSAFSWERTFMRHERSVGSATVHFSGKVKHLTSGEVSFGVKHQPFTFNQVYP